MGVYCDICNVTVPSEIVMKDHVKGKKHLRLADIVNRQRRQAERSVFVRGFPYGTKDAALKKLFSKYGPVDLVFVDRERGSYAIIEFRSRDAVEKLLQPDHSCYLGNKKLTIKPREVKAYVPKKRPEQLPQAKDEQEEVVEVPKYDLDAILTELQSLDNVCAQMNVMRERLKLTEEDLKQREEICQDLETLTSHVFTNCKANQFGSSINGFGMRGCDMDIFLDLNLDRELTVPLQDLHKTADMPFIKDIKALKVENGKITHESLCSTSWRDRIKLLGRILGGTSQFGKNVLTIPSARCPVVKVAHLATGMKCDISINNRMALRNTKFLQFLIQEERLGILAYTAKIWAKLKDLTGQGPRITSYTLTLLVIFYLQQMDPPIFPSVAEFSKLTSNEDKVTLEQWECSFPQKLPPTSNTSSTEQMLKGFFEFYGHFDFGNCVINIRDGRIEDLHEFRSRALANAHLESFKYGPMCVQDPFVLDHNTTLNVNAKVKGQFVMECQEAAAKIAHVKFKDRSSETWGIPFLLSEEKVRQFKVEEETVMGSLMHSQMPYMFAVDHQPMRLPAEFFENVSDPEDGLRKWADCICSSYKRILSEALLFESLPIADRQSPENGASDANGDSAKKQELPSVVNDAETCSKHVPESADAKESSIDYSSQDCDATGLDGEGSRHTSSGIGGNSHDHISTKRSLSHESAMITSESKKCRSETESAENSSHHESVDVAASVVNDCANSLSKNIQTESTETRRGSLGDIELILHHACHRTHHRMWSGRKKVKSKVKVADPDLDPIDIEVKVTEELKNIGELRSEDIILSFETVAVLYKHGGQTELRFYLQPLAGSKEFTCFYGFFRSFFLKIAERLF